MAGRKPNATVCGIPMHLGGPIHYHGGKLAVGVGPLGHYRSISKPGAKRLMTALFSHVRLPRLGHEVKLCEDQYLTNNGAGFDVTRRASGDIRGSRSRRSHRR